MFGSKKSSRKDYSCSSRPSWRCTLPAAPTASSWTAAAISVRPRPCARGSRWRQHCRNHAFPPGSKQNRITARNVKTELAYVAKDMDEELEKLSENADPFTMPYTLPDGKILNLGMERFVVGEVFFQPELVGIEADGVQKFVFDAISKCAVDDRQMFYDNVILSGGSTLMPGFSDRLQADLTQVVPESCSVKVVASDERLYAVWIGASIVSSISSFDAQWVTRAEYEEEGARIVMKKCPV
eukprot:914907_1